jgi:hypothetical protein
MAKKGKRTVKVDFTNVKEGGGKRPHLPPGDYLAKLTNPKIVEASVGQHDDRGSSGSCSTRTLPRRLGASRSGTTSCSSRARCMAPLQHAAG